MGHHTLHSGTSGTCLSENRVYLGQVGEVVAEGMWQPAQFGTGLYQGGQDFCAHLCRLLDAFQRLALRGTHINIA